MLLVVVELIEFTHSGLILCKLQPKNKNNSETFFQNVKDFAKFNTG